MSNTRIAIIGANGQVGSETSLFLRLLPGVEVVPISRSVHGSSLLRRCGFECRHGSFDSPEAARELVGDCDMVLDFALPSGSMPQMRLAIDRIIESAMSGSERLRQYIYMSTMSVYRLDPSQPFYRRYGAIKRYAEKSAVRLGARFGKEAHVLRLAQVHGEMQAITRKIRAEIRPGEISVPDAPSNTVFVFTIAEAVDLIRQGRVPPATHTLVSNPAWSWADIHRHYAAEAGLETTIRLHPAPQRALEFRFLRNLGASLKREIAAQAYANRDLIDDLLVRISPERSFKLRADNARRRTGREITQDPARQISKPYYDEFVAPGPRLEGLSDSRVTMAKPTAKVLAVLEDLMNSKKFDARTPC